MRKTGVEEKCFQSVRGLEDGKPQRKKMKSIIWLLASHIKYLTCDMLCMVIGFTMYCVQYPSKPLKIL